MRSRSLAHRTSYPLRRTALAAAVLGLTLLGTACGGHGGGTGGFPPGPSPSASRTAPGPAASGTPAPVGTWRMLPAAPLGAGRYRVVWTGTDMLVYAPSMYLSGDQSTSGSAGAAYRPGTGTWRRLPSSGLPVRVIEGGFHPVWDGTEMLTWGVQNGAFNPVTNRWRPIAEAPVYGASIVVWTGRQVLMWGGGCCGSANADGAAYTPATDTWRPLPAGPLSGRYTSGAWTGSELVVVGGSAPEQGTFADAAGYNPATGTWRKLPPLPAPRMDATVTWTGTEVIVVGGQPGGLAGPYADALAYNPATNRWRQLPAMDSGRSGHVAVWTGSRLLVWGGQTLDRPATAQSGPTYRAPAHGLAYDPATDRWTALPTAPLRGRVAPAAVWTGQAVLVWGGYMINDPGTPYLDGASYGPA